MNGYILQNNFNFPSSNAVYVDNDYINLRKRGLFAYRTLHEAVVAWSESGEARAVYGIPTGSSPGNIYLGAGVIACGKKPGPTEGMDISVDYINIIGAGKGITILTDVDNTSTNVMRIAHPHVNLYDCTLSGRAHQSALFSIQCGDPGWLGEIVGVEFTHRYGANGNVVTLSASPWATGLFRNCDFKRIDTINSNNMGLCNAGVRGVTIFDSCNFLANDDTVFAVGVGHVECNHIFKNCIISGGKTAIQLSSVSFDGIFKDCQIYNPSGYGVQTTSTNPQSVFDNCSFLTSGAALVMKGNFRAPYFNCNIVSTGGSGHAVYLMSNSNGGNFQGCRIVGNGTGLAIYSEVNLEVDVTNCFLRKPTGGEIGSSIFSGISNGSAGQGSSNEELTSTVII